MTLLRKFLSFSNFLFKDHGVPVAKNIFCMLLNGGRFRCTDWTHGHWARLRGRVFLSRTIFSNYNDYNERFRYCSRLFPIWFGNRWKWPERDSYSRFGKNYSWRCEAAPGILQWIIFASFSVFSNFQTWGIIISYYIK